MRAGDLVRFKYTGAKDEDWKVGLLVGYHTWEKIANILFEGEVVRVRAATTQIHKRAKRK
jgi:hypothetical protein|tara:strand:+ start:246 stop:425 length:180 start_codon:yes stop_codon:yes gene_type:complete